MAKISVALNSIEQATGKKNQKTLTDIKPSATSEQITNFAKGLNSLTTNNYVETNRIEKINTDTEEVTGTASLLTIGTTSSTVEGAMWLEED